MFSFLIQSWLTVFFSFFPAYHVGKVEWRKWTTDTSRGGEGQKTPLFRRALTRSSTFWRTNIQPFQPYEDESSEDEGLEDDRPSPFVSRATELLNPLCDLQIVTSLGIMIAGFAKWTTITFYHEALVTCYWDLTLNSFWATRIEYMDYDTKEDKFRVALRRGFILLSCLLGIAWRIPTYIRELTTDYYSGGLWNDDKSDFCYRFWDGSSPFPWIFGIFLFCVALASSLTERTREFNKRYDKNLKKGQVWCGNWHKNSRERCKNGKQHDLDVGSILEVAAAGITSAVYWILVQWIAVWSYGDGFFPFTWLCYFLFNIWNTIDVISLWRLNQPLLSDEERNWGFGQVLPLAMLLSILFSGVDIWRGKAAPYMNRTPVPG